MTMYREDRDYYDRKLMNSGGSCKACAFSLVAIVIIIILSLFTGCKTQYVPVESVHTEYHHTTDSIFHTDSVFKEKETIVMQLDSEAMAQYGIKLATAERAWLVQSKELEREIARLMSQKTDTFIKVDSIPKIVVKEKELSKWQRLKMDAGVALFAIVSALILFLIIRLSYKKLF